MSKNNKSTQELWAQWSPIEGLANSYDVTSVRAMGSGILIELDGWDYPSHMLRVIFDKPILAYRQTPESYRLETFAYLSERYEKDFYGAQTFFKVSGSKYVEWLQEQSIGAFSRSMCTLFVIFSRNTIIDVVSAFEPRIEKIADTPGELS